jgi:hypothetical protein
MQQRSSHSFSSVTTASSSCYHQPTGFNIIHMFMIHCIVHRLLPCSSILLLLTSAVSLRFPPSALQTAFLQAALRIACSAHSPRHTVEYVIYKLGKRLTNPSWLVVLKGLMTFHRLLRECDPSFQEQVWPRCFFVSHIIPPCIEALTARTAADCSGR